VREPIKIVKYNDGRVAYQIELPPQTPAMDANEYYLASIECAGGHNYPCIVYSSRSGFTIDGKAIHDIFIIANFDGEFPRLLLSDGSRIRLVRKLTDEEYKMEMILFQSALGLSG
jgi:hypothetical protein